MIETQFLGILQTYLSERTQYCIYGHLLQEPTFPYVQCVLEDFSYSWERSLIQFSLLHVSAYLGSQEVLQLMLSTRQALDGKRLDLPESYQGIFRCIEAGIIDHKKSLYTAKDTYKVLIKRHHEPTEA